MIDPQEFSELCISGITLEDYVRRAKWIASQPGREKRLSDFMAQTFGHELPDETMLRLVVATAEMTGGVQWEGGPLQELLGPSRH
jgi:hypothetical protein